MEFKSVSHAGMVVRHGGVELLMDPWLIGSCYWRSWWNFPEPAPELLAELKPDYIYLTHLHWDHFQGPSLHLFDRNTKFIVPRLPTTTRMVDDLRCLGFENVQEVSHGQTLDLGGGMEITSYQSGPGSDSAIVITDGKTTILNANDCKVFGLSLKQITKRFPDIDFVLRSHSSANPVPYCVDSYPSRFADVRTPDDYAREFARFAFQVNAKYAIPFASNHCYLHRDTIRYNALAMDPQRVHDLTNREAESFGVRTRAVMMPSGSAWSDRDGFDLAHFDYGQRDAYVQQLLQKHGAKLEQYYAREAAAVPNEDAFQRYFRKMFTALPPASLFRTLDFKVLFEVSGATTARWLVDFGKRAIDLKPGACPDVMTIRTPALVFNDCCRKCMFSTWSASKRLNVNIPENQGLETLQRLLGLLDLYELKELPLRNNLAPRAIKERLARWREPVDLLSYKWQSRTRDGFRVSDLYGTPKITA